MKTEIKFFNTLGRELQTFKTKHKVVGIYTCGPTVYNYAHIGNLRSYIFADILKRVLLYNKYKVKHVMNYTDVGHLTSDADTGEDKMETAVKREQKSAWEIADFYINAFEQDCEKLNIIEPNIKCRATKHIKEMQLLIQELEKNGYTYIIEDGVYYDSSKFKSYGEFARLNIEGLKAGARVELIKGKKAPTDFSLWKFSPKDKKRQMEWHSPWGLGFPGWHIECSAMSIKHLTNCFQNKKFNPARFDTIDIHTGGTDNIPVHHTNEIAQSEGATGKRFVNYWLHGAFLEFGSEKMAKSAGGFLTLNALGDSSCLPYRYLCLTAHYNSPLSFSWEALDGARNAYRHLKKICLELKNKGNKLAKKSSKEFKKYNNKFLTAINNDLNMPQALAVLWDMLKDKGINNAEKYFLALDFDRVLGLRLFEETAQKQELPKEIIALEKEREKARKDKDWKKADKIREQIRKGGYIINDAAQGSEIIKA
ncbi:cysteine--tRNA ligase [archaeon]|nr:cysteine--tRNA ligase [archaeon]